ncbi:SUMF1/EgtB/PvdO family nonheme iron enzyme [Olivibacter sitiensis]|uniref:type IX secretion system lipoprotein PorK/GldK n=1 Tax=Olivibacter sitiensis TaxID=376470 RepID=UPI0004844547|nr:SUMF1/EgtB/PvdO family nonheme iron enzyme [Olivibacter sitiensis]
MNKKWCFPFLFLLGLFALSACSSGGRGELVGVRLKSIKSNRPPKGMVYIPQGTFIAGVSDEDISFSQIQQNRQFTMSPFYMDETEISNSQYRQFVNWVRDSIAITQYLNDPSYFISPKEGSASDQRFIDWSKVASGKSLWADAANRDKLNTMFYQGSDQIFGQEELDVRLLRYIYETYDLRLAAANKNNPNFNRSDAIIRDTVAVYPDTTVWLTDFAYAQNEPMVEGYFSHPAYQDYPVVGVNWYQAKAFAAWRTQLYEHYNRKQAGAHVARARYDLPSEFEWEYAARGGHINSPYPWGGPSMRNARGCLMANFKVGRGDYASDGGAFTVPVKAYMPNDYGLYNMAGNVAEWTSSAFDESSTTLVHDMVPTYSYRAKKDDPEVFKRKVVRGGSWKDIAYFLQNSTRTFEVQDSSRSYIGFRCVMAAPGMSK